MPRRPSGSHAVDVVPVIAIEGPSGAGKSSVVEALGARLGAMVLREAFERIDPRPSLEYRSVRGLLRLEERLWRAELSRWTEARSGGAGRRLVLMDTGPWGPLTYTWGLRESGEETGHALETLVRTAADDPGAEQFPLPELTIYLDVPEPAAEARAASDPTGHPPRLRGRHRRVARFERILYQELLPGSVPARFLSVDAEPSPRAIAAAIADRLERLGPLPPATPEEAARLFEMFAAAVPRAAGGSRRGPRSPKR